MIRIFIAYAPGDAPAVERLASDLRTAGYDVVVDRPSTGGSDRRAEVLEQIRHCDVVLLALSNGSLSSDAVRRPGLDALQLARPVIGVCLEDPMSPPELPEAFRVLPMARCSGDSRRDLDALVEAIEAAAAPLRPRPGSASGRPPAPASYGASTGGSELHRQVLDALVDVVPGHAVFDPPSSMRQGSTARVVVRIARSQVLDSALTAGLAGPVHIEDLPTSLVMAVELHGDGFDVTELSDVEQLLSDDGITEWQFDILARRGGEQRLTLRISLRITVAGTDRRRSVPVLERTVAVEVNVLYGVTRFLTGNWQWLVGTAAGLGGAIAAWVALF